MEHKKLPNNANNIGTPKNIKSIKRHDPTPFKSSESINKNVRNLLHYAFAFASCQCIMMTEES